MVGTRKILGTEGCDPFAKQFAKKLTVQRLSCPSAGGRSRRGLTKIELLILICAFAPLVALMASAVIGAREREARVQCTNNLKQIGLGCHNFESTFRRLPPLYGGGPQGGAYP